MAAFEGGGAIAQNGGNLALVAFQASCGVEAPWCGLTCAAVSPCSTQTDFTLQASFLGAPAQVALFLIRTGIDDMLADVSSGVEALSAGAVSLQLFYDGRFGVTIEENAGGAKATVPF